MRTSWSPLQNRFRLDSILQTSINTSPKPCKALQIKIFFMASFYFAKASRSECNGSVSQPVVRLPEGDKERSSLERIVSPAMNFEEVNFLTASGYKTEGCSKVAASVCLSDRLPIKILHVSSGFVGDKLSVSPDSEDLLNMSRLYRPTLLVLASWELCRKSTQDLAGTVVPHVVVV